MKRAAPEDVLRTARDLRAVTRGTRTLFVVNDDPAVAAAAGADGVHVGQGDMPVPEVRRRFPSLRLVGLSTHNPAQLAAAAAVRPDYVGVGPVHATPTKEIPDPTLGLATMAAMVAAAGESRFCAGAAVLVESSPSNSRILSFSFLKGPNVASDLRHREQNR